MTCKELLLGVNFDDVLPYIGEMEKKRLDMAAAYYLWEYTFYGFMKNIDQFTEGQTCQTRNELQ